MFFKRKRMLIAPPELRFPEAMDWRHATDEEVLQAIRSVPTHFAAPTAAVRGTPAGYKLKDGYSTKITLTLNPTIEFWEKTVTASGMDGLEKIDQTTMFNLQWRTFRPRALVTRTDLTIKAAYNPLVNSSILSAINREDTITETYPDGSTLAWYGFLKSFIPDALEEGKQPECTIVFCPTNFDKVNNVEAGPTYVDVPGT